MKISWSSRATKSFNNCIAYIELDSSVNAEKWAFRIFEKIESIVDFPEIGKVSNNLPNMRVLILEKNFVINYRIVKDKCRIMTFRRVSQNEIQ